MAQYLAITGGVGGAKLALGLTHILSPQELTFLVNTGDDFEHLGVHVSPDIDTLMYTLSGLSNPETGWGRVNESWNFIATVRELGGDGWFNLGDRDLAIHTLRTQALSAGEPLSAITKRMFETLGVAYPVYPMSDKPVRTMVDTAQGELGFQHYFVREHCEPVVTGLRFIGAEDAAAPPSITQLLLSNELQGIIICPSNPFLSVDPILAVNGLRDALKSASAPLIAVSPIIGGTAVKGPTAKIMAELELQVSTVAVAEHYGDLLDGFIIDQTDRDLKSRCEALGVETVVAQTLMKTLDDRVNLAQTAVKFLSSLR
ncbi:MAG: 2-phospho-L-lactate transferase [Pseudomonadota bacterium]